MPKSKQLTEPRDQQSAAPSLDSAALCARADALYRAAAECCRQHERLARLVARSDDEAEQRAAYDQSDHCDRALAEMAAAYEKVGARLHPDGPDGEWWHRANTLWHASREFARRHEESNRLARRSATARDPELLATLNMDFELEASALLALRQAMDAYQKVRPHAAC